ncbi:Actin cytoskeleton-regulatory complex protein PAN1 [Smittium culicis]|uniref:Actin cytoskeleton-regulatory complex protein PAN1 n=1 Tax=Smittium culicis TaxID=133412 RepID=A0A1R1XUN0_9FUNG|nr:Actin cytoskeleton-regulatory complex protein PAN1 [Smittium culicis]
MNRFPTSLQHRAGNDSGFGSNGIDGNSSMLGHRSVPPPYSALNNQNINSNIESSSTNPFGVGLLDRGSENNGESSSNPASLRHLLVFNNNADLKTKLIGGKIASSLMEEFGLRREDLRRVWQVSDWDSRGSLDTVQFEVAMRMCEKLADNVPFQVAEDSTFRELGLR